MSGKCSRPSCYVSQKKKSRWQPEAAKPEKGLRRGIVKWAPPHIEGEDQASHDKHVNWMQQEAKKKDKRYSLVTRKMDLTYSFRREYLTKQPVPLLQLKQKYPFLFHQNEVSKPTLVYLLPEF